MSVTFSDDQDGFPLPRRYFPDTQLPIHDLVEGSVLWRSHWNYHDALHYATDGRFGFNSSGHGGCCYAAEAIDGAYIESVRRNEAIDRFIKLREFSHLATVKPLRLAKLYGSGLARMGATAEVTHCGQRDYARSAKWAEAIWRHPDGVDGIAYHSRHDDKQLCYAIFERAGGLRTLERTTTAWDRHPDIGRLVNKYDHRYYGN